MTTEQALSLVSIVVAICAPVAQVLFERYLQRRDLRRPQSDGDAPSHRGRLKAVAAWIAKCVFFGLPGSLLFVEVMSTEPLTRMSVFIIALLVASLISMFLYEFFRGILLVMVGVQKRSLSHARDLLNNQRELLDVQSAHVKVTQSIAKRSSSRRRRNKASKLHERARDASQETPSK